MAICFAVVYLRIY